MGFGKFGFLFIYLCSFIKPQNPQIVIADRCWRSYSGFTSGAVLLVLLLITPNSLFPSTSSIDSLSRLLKKEMEITERIRITNQLGIAFRNVSNPEAIRLGKLAIDLAHKNKSYKYIAQSNNVIGVAYKYLQELDSASLYFTNAITLAQTYGHNTDIEKGIVNLSSLFFDRHFCDERILFVLDSLTTHFYSKGLVSPLLTAAREYCRVSFFTGNLLDASEIANKYLDYSIKHGELNFVYDFKNLLAGIYQTMGDYDKAIAVILSALELLKTDTFNENLYHSLIHNLGVIYFEVEDYDNALRYFYKHQAYFSERNQEEYSLALHNIGGVYLETSKYPKAISYYERALAIAERHGIPKLVGLNYLGLGNAHFKLKNYDSAYRYYSLAHERVRPFDYKQVEVFSLLGLSRLYIKRNEFNQSKRMAYDALSISKQIGSKALQKECYEVLYTIYDSIHDYQHALKYYIYFASARDSIFSEMKTKEIMRLKAHYQAGEKDKLIAAQKHIIAQSKKLKNLYITLGISSALFITLFFLAVYYRQRRLTLKERFSLLQLKGYALYTQIGEHFVSNSISRIYTLIRLGQEQDAERYAKKFSDFLKHNIYSIRKDRITLEKELQMLQTYVDLESMKGNEFSFRIEVDDAIDPSKLFIPPLLIQPMVENSIKHGMFAGCNSDNGIAIKIARVHGSVQICIEDNGQGITHSPRGRNTEGYGLTITQERLKLLHPSNAMVIEPLDRGVRVTLRMNLKAMTDV